MYRWSLEWSINYRKVFLIKEEVEVMPSACLRCAPASLQQGVQVLGGAGLWEVFSCRNKPAPPRMAAGLACLVCGGLGRRAARL